MWSSQSRKEKFKKSLEGKILESLYPPPSSDVIKVASRGPTKPALHMIQKISLHAIPIERTNENVLNARDGRVRVRNTAEWPNSAHGLLTWNFNNKAYWGTGIMIGPNIVLTAGHNLYQREEKMYADPKSLKFLPGMDGSVPPFDSVGVEQFFVSPNYIQEGTEDYGLLILKKPIGEVTGYFGLAVLEPDKIKEKRINIVGYPYDKVIHKPSCTFEMWGMEGTASHVDQDKALMNYLIDTTPGQSGSGVWYQEGEDYYVCGVHVSGSQLVNTATLLTRAVYQQIHSWLQQVSFKHLLSKFEETKELKFQGQEITAECATLLMKLNLNQLTCLDISKNQIDAGGATQLAKNDSWINLVELDLSGEPFKIPFCLQEILALTTAALIGTGIGGAFGIILFGASKIQEKYFFRSFIEAEGAKGLATNKSWVNLSKLNLSWSQIRAEGAKELAANKSWVNLSQLNLSGNVLGDRGVIALAKNESWVNLSQLDLSWNCIDAIGARGLATNRSWINLSQLDLSYNIIGHEGAKELLKNRFWTKLSKLTYGIVESEQTKSNC